MKILVISAAMLASAPAFGQTQTLNQATINSSTIVSSSIYGGTLWTPTIASPAITGPGTTITGPSITGGILTGPTITTPTISGGTLTGPAITNPTLAGTLMLSGNPIKLDPAGNATMQWNASNNNIAVSGPIWNSSVQYAPWKSPAPYNWNFDGINYSVNASQVPGGWDGGQTVAHYAQMLKYGSANTQLWGAVIEMNDQTGMGVAANGAEIGLELDMVANGAIATGGSRQAITIVAQKAVANGTPVDAGTAISIHGPANGVGGWFETGYQPAAAFSIAAYDSRFAEFMPGAHDIWLGDGRDIAFDSAGTQTLMWNQVTSKTEFSGSLFFKNLVQLMTYTVATLPACASWYQGGMAAVSDALNPSYNAPLVGGGSTRTIAFCGGQGSTWTWTAH